MQLKRFLITASAVLASFSAAHAQGISLQDVISGSKPLPEATIYVAKEIITMDPNRPRAEAVAVIRGKIAAVGSRSELEALSGPQKYRVDDTFRDKVIMPGFVEQHVHPLLTSLMLVADSVIAIEDWETANGPAPAARTEDAYKNALKAALARYTPGDSAFLTWGYHHYFHGPMSRALLDEMAPDFPVIVWHRSMHEIYLNSQAMEKYGVTSEYVSSFTASQTKQSNFEEGHFWEQGLFKVIEKVAPAMATPERLVKGLQYSEDFYHRNGITIAAEPGGVLSRDLQNVVNSVYGDDATPFNHYFIPDGKSLFGLYPDDPDKLLLETETVTSWGNGRAKYLPKQVKLFMDGAIYSQLMQMRDGYTDGHHGEWIMDPEVFNGAFQTYWDAGYQIHIHNNGDKGLDVLLDNLEEAQRRNPRYDHRTVIVHYGFAASDQIVRASRLGALVSANPYYVTALADKYAEIGIGPERTARMVPLGEAERLGLSLSFHSDMPMAPAKPLQLVWSAVTRLTADGKVNGPDQAVSLDTALKAITIDAAYSIQLENEVGSITPGKMANFTVLDDSPYDVAPDKLKNIGIWGTVLEGRVQPVSRAAGQKAETPAALPADVPVRVVAHAVALQAAHRSDHEPALGDTPH